MRRIFLVAVLWCLATGAQAASTIVPNLLPVGIPPNSGLINQNFQNAANDVNALQNLNAGVTAPSNPSLGYFWLSTPQNATTYPLNLWDGTRWSNVASLDSISHIWMPPIGGGVPPTILSATTTDLGSVPQAFVYVSGTNPIQSFGSSAPIGTIKVVDFLATTTLTSNPSLLILPGSTNLTTAPGDTLLAAQIAAGQWALISYNRASGGTIIQPVIGTPPTVVGDCVAWATTNATLLSDTGHPCGSSGGSVVGPSMSTIGHCALWANTTGTLLSDVVCPGLVTAATNTALMAISTAATSYVMRLGVNAAGDAPAQVFQALASPCTLNSGAGDVGWQAGSADGKCWVAIFANPQGVDLREWGNVGTSDDTVIWQTIDASMGNVGWPTQVPKTVMVPPITSPVTSFVFSNIQRIIGTPNLTELTCSSMMGSSGPCWEYVGSGPLRIDDLTIGCEDVVEDTVGHIVGPLHCGDTIFETYPASPTVLPGNFVVRNVNLIGGVNQFSTYQAANLDLQFNRVYDSFGFGVVVSTQNLVATGGFNTGGNLQQASHNRIVINDCRMTADYCLSTPVTFPPSTSTYTGTWIAPADLEFDVHCVGGGWSGKGCVDATGTAAEQMNGSVVAINSWFGLESKTGNITATASPTAYRDRYFKVDMKQTMDKGPCVIFDQEVSLPGGTVNPMHLAADINCQFSQARPWQSGFPQSKGDVFVSTNGWYYMVAKAGVSGSVAPSAMVVNGTEADGTSTVLFTDIEQSDFSANTGALNLNNINGANINLTIDNLSYGVLLQNQGEGNVTQNVNLVIHGTATRHCVQDSLITLNSLNGTNDQISIDGSCLILDNHTVTESIAPAAIELGNGDGAGHFNNYTNLTVRGNWTSPFLGGNGSQSYGLRFVPGGSIQGKFIGANFTGYTEAIYIQNAVNLTLIGGLYADLGTGSFAGGPIRLESTSTGTLTAVPSVAIENSNTADPDVVIVAGSTIVPAGMFVDDPPVASQPSNSTYKCSNGQAVYSTTAGHLYICQTPAPSTAWATAY